MANRNLLSVSFSGGCITINTDSICVVSVKQLSQIQTDIKISSIKMSFFLFTTLLMPLLIVHSHPINMVCVPVCNTSITANETLINHWLDNDDSTGIDQLLNKEDTVTEELLRLSSTDVSIYAQLHTCI